MPNENQAAPGGPQGHKVVLTGIVISDKMDKTITVQVTRTTHYPVYRKVIKKRTSFKAHDENNKAKAGDKVRIIQTRPLSKDKRWRLLEVVIQ